MILHGYCESCGADILSETGAKDRPGILRYTCECRRQPQVMTLKTQREQAEDIGILSKVTKPQG